VPEPAGRRALLRQLRALLGALALPAGAHGQGPGGNRSQGPELQPRATPAPLAQILPAEPVGPAGTGRPGALLGLGRDGRLWSWPVDGGEATLLGEDLDPATPLAAGHGRVAARRADGALWVWEAEAGRAGGRARLSGQGQLAPHAGLLVLPLAVIGVSAAGHWARHRLLRFEPDAGRWREVARSEESVLPDARPLQADLDGRGDGGHLVVLAGADDRRYRHGVLGDAIEATQVLLLERHSLEPMRRLVLPDPWVLEDIAPRRVAVDGRDGLLSMRAGAQGAQLVLIEADPAQPGVLHVAAEGPPIGQRHRWLAPVGDAGAPPGAGWLAVHTPHIGGVLIRYRRAGARLQPERLLSGPSNHALGARDLDVSAWLQGRLLMSTGRREQLQWLDVATASVAREWNLPAALQALVALDGGRRAALLLADGRLMVLG
jgi:hypothetical protein